MPEWLSLNPVLLAVTGVASISVLISVVIANRAMKRVRVLETHIDELGTELNAMTHSTLGMGRKLHQLTESQDTTLRALEQIQKNDPTKVSYSEASKLVAMGADIEQLMNACGISRPEAELVSALAKRKSAQGDVEKDVPVLNTKL